MQAVARGLIVSVAVLLGCAASAPDTSQSAQMEAAVQPAGPPQAIHVDLSEQEPGGACVKAAMKPVYAHHGVVVQWRVTNSCGGVHTVGVTNFRIKGTTTSYWPFTQPEGPRDCRAQPKGGTCMITLTIKPDRTDGAKGVWVFEYDVLLDGTKLDPEIIIEWF